MNPKKKIYVTWDVTFNEDESYYEVNENLESLSIEMNNHFMTSQKSHLLSCVEGESHFQ